MEMGDFISTSPGAVGGPAAHNAYKRAVYRKAPARFAVEMLQPSKQGGSVCYGMRISPVYSDTDSVKTSSSASGSGKSAKTGVTAITSTPTATAEYDIWRRWEDCLLFQDTLEAEYANRSREKRQGLAAGMGVKKNGVYIRSDRAASFDSLPPGPDPQSIAKNIHDYLPRLTKKGTLFRASSTTVAQRQAEVQALVDALFRDDLPTLMRELRASRTVRDFFGFWRRDQDLEHKHRKRPGKAPDRASVASSAFSMYFSASTPSLVQAPWGELPPSPALPHTAFMASSTPFMVATSTTFLPSPAAQKQRAAAAATAYPTPPNTAHSPVPPPRQLQPPRTPSPSPPAHRTAFSDAWRTAPLRIPQSAPAVSGITFTLSNSSSDSDGPLDLAAPRPALPPRNPRRADTTGTTAAPTTPSKGKVAFAAHAHAPLVAPQDLPLMHARLAVAQHRRLSGGALHLGDAHDSLAVVVEGSELADADADADHEHDDDAGARPESFSSGSDVDPFAFERAAPPPPRPRERDVLLHAAALRANRQGRVFVGGDGPAEGDADAADTEADADVDVASALEELDAARMSWRTQSSASASLWAARSSVSSSTRLRPPSSMYSFAGDIEIDFPRPPDNGAELARLQLAAAGAAEGARPPPPVRRATSPPPSVGAGVTVRRSLSMGSSRAKRGSASHAPIREEEVCSEGDADSVLDSYYYAPSSPSSALTPSSPRRERVSIRLPNQFHLPWSPAAPMSPILEPPTSAVSTASGFAPDDAALFSIKAVLRDEIVVFRAPRAIALADARARLREKLAAQEGVQLSSAFALAYHPPSAAEMALAARPPTAVRGPGAAAAQGRPRSSSASSVGDACRLRFISSQDEWADVVASCGPKLTLRVVDSK